MKTWNIGIIGGGPGGLMTAYLLQQRANHPFLTTIFEAGSRLGGKIRTERFTSIPVSYEAGAAELYGYSKVGEDPLSDLIQELGLPTQPMEGSAVILDDRVLANSDDIRDQLGTTTWKALEEFDRCAKDWMSTKEYYHSDWQAANRDPVFRESFRAVLSRIPDATARRFLQVMLHSDLATEPHRTNGTYGLQNYLMNDPAYMQLYTITGGIECLPRELARRIEATVRLNQPVVHVDKRKDGKLRVISRQAGKMVADTFDFVVVALPNNYLPSIHWGRSVLARAMKSHHERYNYPAHYLRVTILFKQKFWRDRIDGSYFMLDQFDGCCLYDESSRNGSGDYGVLGWLLGGKAASTLSQHADDELIEMMLEALPSFWKRGREFFVEGRVHRWVGAVNGLPGGAPACDLDSRHVPEPAHHPNLLVVGDYLFDSTLNGVLDSADFVTDWLVAEMEHPCGERPVPKARRRRLLSRHNNSPIVFSGR